MFLFPYHYFPDDKKKDESISEKKYLQFRLENNQLPGFN